MSDSQVAAALRSKARLVLVEAPAGCGKTFQGAAYARDLLPDLSPKRLLVLTHTNAARDVFADRTNQLGKRVEIRTIDSLITSIATAYHSGLHLPSNVTAWAFQRGSKGFNELAEKVSILLTKVPAIARSLANRYPYVVCDEHQDSSEAQHKIIISIHRAGSFVRIFGDPMQAIYSKQREIDQWDRRWAELRATADERVGLDTPHRWKNSAPELGEWISEARCALKAGREIDLQRSLPKGLRVFRADNTAQRHGLYMVCATDRRPIDDFVKATSEVLVLASTNVTVRGLRAFFNRSLPIWEGHTREALSHLMQACAQHEGDSGAIGAAFVQFVQHVTTGFSNSSFGTTLLTEIADGCSLSRREKPAKLQAIARHILHCPDHRGVARALSALNELIRGDTSFVGVRVDLRREFLESTRFDKYDTAQGGLAELHLRRIMFRPQLPPKTISTVHKAKGLEKEAVLLVPCDNEHFGLTDAKRRLLYVALSRATTSLAIVLPRRTCSPLFRV